MLPLILAPTYIHYNESNTCLDNYKHPNIHWNKHLYVLLCYHSHLHQYKQLYAYMQCFKHPCTKIITLTVMYIHRCRYPYVHVSWYKYLIIHVNWYKYFNKVFVSVYVYNDTYKLIQIPHYKCKLIQVLYYTCNLI